MSQQDLLTRAVEAMNQAGIDFMITGSVASSLQGEPRSTHDLDMVVAISEAAIPNLRAAFGAIGYGQALWPIPAVGTGQTRNLGEIELEAVPVTMAGVSVQGRRSRLTPGSELVRRRQLLGKGTFFAGAVLKALDPQSLTRHLAAETDFWVKYDERGVPSISNPREDCTLVFVNEWPLNQSSGDAIFRPASWC